MARSANETPLVPLSTHNPGGWVDIEQLRNADGLMAIISQRAGNGTLTFCIYKEFERDGQTARTTFIAFHLAESFKRMVELVTERMQVIIEKELAPYPVGVGRGRP